MEAIPGRKHYLASRIVLPDLLGELGRFLESGIQADSEIFLGTSGLSLRGFA
jgi:hypothetical protein